MSGALPVQPQYVQPVAGRSCGSCTMCCKSFDVHELSKPAGKMCDNCSPGKGCKIWDIRPKTCADFLCQWILDKRYPDNWRPDISKFILKNSDDGRIFAVVLDRTYRDHWKKEPYYSFFKKQAAALLEDNKYLMVGDSVNQILILPEEEVIIGPIDANIPFHVDIAKLHGKTRYRAVIGGK